MHFSFWAGVAGFDDSVFFALSCRGADIAHALSYPLYALLCHPFVRLLSFKPAFTTAMFSAICAVLACHILAAIIYSFVNNRFAANGEAMLYGVSAGFWAKQLFLKFMPSAHPKMLNLASSSNHIEKYAGELTKSCIAKTFASNPLDTPK